MTGYGFFAAAGGVTAVAYLKRHRADLGLSENQFWAAIWTLLVGGIVGAKLLFVVLGWEHYAHGELHFWADFNVGFVFFGGLVGAFVAGAVFAWIGRHDFARGADYFAVALPLGHALGRVGCFVAGCCPGRPPHPVQLYEAAGLVLIAALARHVLGQVQAGERATGTAFRAYLILYGMLRFSLDPLRADGRIERWAGLSAQQGIAATVVLCALAWAWAWSVEPQRLTATPRAREPGRDVDGPPRAPA